MNASRPAVTIILPIRNEENSIGACIKAITQQNYPLDKIEVIIADGLSQDETREVIAAYHDKLKH